MAQSAESRSVNGLPPWLEPTWRRLVNARRDARLAQAFLISGPAGVGKGCLVDQLIGLLLCKAKQAEERPCGHCADCHLLAAGNHPDQIRLAPEAAGASAEIRADAVRALCSREGLTPTRGEVKVLVVRPAEAMNAFAANSLLKTLEEPVASSIWLLVSEQPQRLPQTIRSRCQRLELAPPPESEALPWLRARLGEQAPQCIDAAALCLRLAHGAPLQALQWALNDQLRVRQNAMDGLVAIAEGRRDPLAIAAEWQPLEVRDLVALISDWVSDLLRLVADRQGARLINLDARAMLETLAARLDPHEGHDFLRHLLQINTLLDAPINKPLLLESLLVRWALLMQPRE